jgi:hypothetical protein
LHTEVPTDPRQRPTLRIQAGRDLDRSAIQQPVPTPHSPALEMRRHRVLVDPKPHGQLANRGTRLVIADEPVDLVLAQQSLHLPRPPNPHNGLAASARGLAPKRHQGPVRV